MKRTKCVPKLVLPIWRESAKGFSAARGDVLDDGLASAPVGDARRRHGPLRGTPTHLRALGESRGSLLGLEAALAFESRNLPIAPPAQPVLAAATSAARRTGSRCREPCSTRRRGERGEKLRRLCSAFLCVSALNRLASARRRGARGEKPSRLFSAFLCALRVSALNRLASARRRGARGEKRSRLFSAFLCVLCVSVLNGLAFSAKTRSSLRTAEQALLRVPLRPLRLRVERSLASSASPR